MSTASARETELEVSAAAPSAHIDADDVEAGAETKINSATHSDTESHLNDKEKSTAAAAAPPTGGPPKPSPAPDGGLAAYSVVAGGFLTLFCSFGFLNNFAAFQTYYVNVTLRGYSNSDVAWIGAMQSFSILAANLLMGPLFDRYGPRPLLIAATFLFSFGCMMTSLADKYYQIFLAQGVVVGMSLGAAFITPIACVMQWFDKKRPAMLGIVISGSSIGGVVWPIITYHLLQNVGFGWTWRALGFIGLGLLSVCVMTVRMPPYAIEAKKNRPPQAALALDAFKTPRYVVYIIGYNLFALGLFPLLFYFPELASRYGVNESLSFATISILNAWSFVGRCGLPILAQKTGIFNTAIVTIAMCGVVCFASMAIDSGAGAIIASCAFGFTSGGALSLAVGCIPPCVPDFRRIGASMGQIFFIGSFFALLSGPIAGWILETAPRGNWIAMEGYVGAVLLLSAMAMATARHMINPNWLTVF